MIEINVPCNRMLEMNIIKGFKETNFAKSKIMRFSKDVYPKSEYIIMVKLAIARKFWIIIIFSLTKYLVFTSTCRLK